MALKRGEFFEPCGLEHHQICINQCKAKGVLFCFNSIRTMSLLEAMISEKNFNTLNCFVGEFSNFLTQEEEQLFVVEQFHHLLHGISWF